MNQIVRLPANHWQPRPYQKRLWTALEDGKKRVVGVWHRRAGKDDVALHWTAVALHERVGTYWHMLPEASQARKAIWEAVNPHTGKRRIDEAFPIELRQRTLSNEMFIRFKNGSTWQVVGSDNFDSLIGSPPVGIVFSEYALANPRAWSVLRPILRENGGWAIFISTPRGRNHLHRMLELARHDMERDGGEWFAEVLTAQQSGRFTPQELELEREEYISENGPDDGQAMFDQEYMVSFDAPLVGAFYARMIADLEAAGRITLVRPWEPDGRLIGGRPVPRVPVETGWDLGWSDDTAIWWFQVLPNEVRVIDYYADHGQTIAHYAKVVRERGWWYGGDPTEERHWVPHDAVPETLAAGGKSILEQLWNNGVKGRPIPGLGVQDGIQAVRLMLPRMVFDKTKCADGLEVLRNYSREWDDDKKVFKRTPLHNWASHGADAMRYAAIAMRERIQPEPEKKKGELRVGRSTVTMDEAWDTVPAQSWRI